MPDVVQFKARVAQPNIFTGTLIPLTVDEPYLVASLKGAEGLTLQSTASSVWVDGEFGITHATGTPSEFTIQITRIIGGGSEVLVFQSEVSIAGGDADGHHIFTASHVDRPGATGQVRYFLYVILTDGAASLNFPVTFVGAQFTPV